MILVSEIGAFFSSFNNREDTNTHARRYDRRQDVSYRCDHGNSASENDRVWRSVRELDGDEHSQRGDGQSDLGFDSRSKPSRYSYPPVCLALSP